MYLYICKKKI